VFAVWFGLVVIFVGMLGRTFLFHALYWINISSFFFDHTLEGQIGVGM
jgi:hypothetical protein